MCCCSCTVSWFLICFGVSLFAHFVYCCAHLENTFFSCCNYNYNDTPCDRYISTYYVRKGIDFGSFKRDVLLFKSVALAQLFYSYFFPTTRAFELDCVSLAMIVSGYAVSVMATNAIGIDRTYFAAELGLVKPKWIEQFPYG